MTAGPSTAAGRDDSSGSSGPVATSSDVPQRADGVQLMGEMRGSGYREPPALARRADGQTIQLTGLLYLVLEGIDGRRTVQEIAEHVSGRFGRTVSADNVRSLVSQQLQPMGLLVRADGGQPEVRKADPLLALRFKYAVSDPDRTRRLTDPFARLFHPVLAVIVLAAFLGVCWWVFLEKGLASATSQAFDKPGLLLLVVAVTVLSAGFHEFGHAAAARRGGATPGVMGAGVYLVWPAFFTDVTDSYRLGRGGRVRTDLGGLYFNAIVAVAITGIWWVTGYDALLLVVATQILQMLHQMTPLVRFDGYHVLADVTGVPDLFHRIKPTLLGLLPWRWRHPETTVLKPWARAVVSVWVLVVVPMLLFSLFTMVITLPRILGTAWVSLLKQSLLLSRAWGEADLLQVAARGIAIIAVAFPVIAIGFILVRLGRSVGTSTWRRTKGKPVKRGLATLVAASLVAGLAYAWWPHPGSYRPIMPFEGGTLTQAVSAATSVARPAPAGLVEGQYGRLVTAWADGDARPTQAHPQLALVLVPHGSSASTAGGTAGGTTSSPTGGTAAPEGGDTAQPWVFPFNKPIAAGQGDNQALAVNTRDNTITYDVAFALVWVTDDSPALNRNESYAFASCTHCAAVSVAFQVVLVTGDNHVAAPQNISAAVNYDCVDCLTYALATQLFVTLKGPLSALGQKQIATLWQQIADLGTHITEVPISEIRDRLTVFEQQILQVIEKEQGPLSPEAPAATSPPTASPTASPSASPTATPSDAGTAAADRADGVSPSADASASGSSTDAGTSDSADPADGTAGSATASDPGGSSAGPSPPPQTSSAGPSSSPQASDVSPAPSGGGSPATATTP